MVKAILKEQRVEVPENVKVTLKSKVIVVEGKNGRLERSFKSMPVQIVEERTNNRVSALNIRIWFAKSKPSSCINTIATHVRNMITGVSHGFHYVMRFGYNLHPMQPIAKNDGKTLEVLNYIGRKYKTVVNAAPGVTISTGNADSKKEIDLEGLDPNQIGLTASLINQKCRPRDKDRRLFRDGIYIHSRRVKS